MKTKIALLAALSFLTLPALAITDFSGHWVGSGDVNSNIGIHSHCNKIDLVIEQTATTFNMKRYVSDCDMFGSDWGPYPMDLQGNQVIDDGDHVGSIDGDTLKTTLPDSSVTYAFNLKMITNPDGTRSVQSYYGVVNAVGAMATEGVLHRVP